MWTTQATGTVLHFRTTITYEVSEIFLLYTNNSKEKSRLEGRSQTIIIGHEEPEKKFDWQMSEKHIFYNKFL